MVLAIGANCSKHWLRVLNNVPSETLTLLQKNREAALTAAGTAEIDLYEQLDTLIGFLKIRAYAALEATPQN